MNSSVAHSWRRDVRCLRCGEVAAALLVDYESAGRGLTVTLNEFLRRKTSFLSIAASEGIAEVEDVELPRWLPSTFAGFLCHECGGAYCRRCWTVGPREYEDGEYAGTYGVCPAGHRGLIDE
jgi:hypothetical protein